MKSYRSIVSLTLLSAYALLPMHDLIPHSHHKHRDNFKVAAQVDHKHNPHNKGRVHQHRGGEDDGYSESTENKDFADHLIHSHSHSGNVGHHHDMSYRAASKDDLILLVVAVQYLAVDLWKLPDQIGYSDPWQIVFQRSLFNRHFSPGIRLRGPPA